MLQLFSRLVLIKSTQFFLVVVRIYMIFVADEAFFPSLQTLPRKMTDCLFPVSWLNIQAKFIQHNYSAYQSKLCPKK